MNGTAIVTGQLTVDGPTFPSTFSPGENLVVRLDLLEGPLELKLGNAQHWMEASGKTCNWKSSVQPNFFDPPLLQRFQQVSDDYRIQVGFQPQWNTRRLQATIERRPRAMKNAR